MTSKTQAGILAPIPLHARYLSFSLNQGADPSAALRALSDLADGNKTVVGLGQFLVLALGRDIEGLGTFPSHAGAGVDVPSAPAALWCWLRGEDRGELLLRAKSIARALAPAFQLSHAVDAFRYGSGRDLTGYEDGTENPKEAAAVQAAVVAGRGPGLDGASFVAVQEWAHDLDKFAAMATQEQDH